MTRSLIGNIVLAAMIFFLPLALMPERILHPGPWLGFAAGAIVLITQPPLGVRKMVTDERDRMSGLVIFAGQIGGQVAAMIEYGYRRELRPAPISVPVLTGCVVAIVGLALRLWAIRTLGRFFTSTVQVQSGQTVVQTGPYALLRHPSYTGALLTALATPIAVASLMGVAVILLVAVPAYLYRIAIEERTLLAGLGDPYRNYRARTLRLIPYLF